MNPGRNTPARKRKARLGQCTAASPVPVQAVSRVVPVMAAALLTVTLLTAGPAAAQLMSSGSGKPVDIDADNALEWHQKELAYVARGHARATQEDTTVYGDVLTAWYREEQGQGKRVHQMVGEGNVRIVSPDRVVEGDRAVYDTDRRILVVTGKKLRLTTPQQIVTARDSLEYYEGDALLVARGDAVAAKADGPDRIKADVLLGRIVKGPDGKDKMDRIDGAGHVVVINATDVAQSDKLVYSVADDVAVLIGNVRITRGDNQLNGQTAEMNMKTKVNRLVAGPETAGRVKALLIPGDKDKAPDASPAGTSR